MDVMQELDVLIKAADNVKQETGRAQICGVVGAVSTPSGVMFAMCTRHPEHQLVQGRPRHSWEP